MRKIAATYIFPITQAPIKNGILVCEDDGGIIELIDRGDQFREEAGVEFYSGILVPGFVSLNYNLQNHNKVSNRRMWAQGIALASDSDNSRYVIIRKNDYQIQDLTTGSSKRVVESGDLSTNSVANSNKTLLNDLFLAVMLSFQEKNKPIELNDVLNWASLNIAKRLGLETKFGSFEKGKNPGVNLISGIDFRQMKLTPVSKVKRLV